MDITQVISLAKEAVWVTILASLPAIIASLVIGLFIALFSATTQIQEQTLSFAPKMVGVYLSLLAFGSFLGNLILKFTRECFFLISGI